MFNSTRRTSRTVRGPVPRRALLEFDEPSTCRVPGARRVLVPRRGPAASKTMVRRTLITILTVLLLQDPLERETHELHVAIFRPRLAVYEMRRVEFGANELQEI